MTVNERPENTHNQRRRYHSPTRQRQAGATRRRIIAAAERLFAAQGYAAVTMEAIAREAGVSLATIYLHFPGRAAMIGALAEEIVAAPELSVEQVVQDPDPIAQARMGARIMRQLNERAWLIVDILRGEQESDPELARLWALWRQRHLDAMRRAVAAIAATGSLRPGLDPDEAADTLYALGGTGVYRALTQERGWSPARYEQWFFELACRELLAHPV